MTRPSCGIGHPAFDPSLYLVTDPVLCAAGGLAETVAAAIAGGVTMIQYRAKDRDLRSALAEAATLAELAKQAGVPLIVNDRLDIALAVDADGLHVGQFDMPPEIARGLLGADKILGISVSRPAEIETIDPAMVDYVGLGPVFATATKGDAAAPLGLQQFAKLRQRILLPVVAIGGIGHERASAVIQAGADGIAVVSAICGTADPAAAARQLKKSILDARP
ncbi:thiamine phosphate synthase [Dongia soli]|uniref:Thiamine-phosphate synthase n=1 Tax=Dongia soli TaxID=600628 RepID=A0ABU5E8N4_9PROT|nr:thiamine phosphate synthase [Dongia soli]MDY0882688.1 thiamine phosphate synthase [Dongia soli]